MKYRIRNLLTGEIVTDENYYLTRDGQIEHIHTGSHSDLHAEMHTGVEDVNGVDIYEGDIVHKEPNGIIWTVEYGSFGDSKFYACNGLNSCRELEEDYGVTGFTMSINFIPCEILVDC